MKKLSNVFWGLIALALLIPAVGMAQWQNELGIYTEDMASNITSDFAVTTTVYFVITNPYNVDEDRPVEWVNAYECSIELEGTGFLLALRWPVDAINIGTMTNQIVGFASGVQVVDQAAVIAEMDVFYADSTGGPLTLTLKPVEPPSIPGYMAYVDGDSEYPNDGLISLMTVSGDWNSPVFAINADPEIVATDQSSFDNIKAMYR